MAAWILFAQRNDAGEAAFALVFLAVMLVMMVVSVALFALWVWMLIDCISNETEENKLLWILLIVLLGGVGALLYFFIRRPQRLREVGK